MQSGGDGIVTTVVVTPELILQPLIDIGQTTISQYGSIDDMINIHECRYLQLRPI